MKFAIFRAAILTAALLGSVLSAGAENLLLDEITVRGKKESPNEENLNIREVRESPARDIGEALKQVEGLSYVHRGAIANDIVLRGFQRDNINVFMDGVRLHGACPGRMDPPAFHFDFAEIEQIRIIKGPYDIDNPGSMGGVVDAQSKKPKKGFGSDLNFTYGSYDSINTSGTVSYGADDAEALFGYAYKYSGVPKSGNGRLITDIYPPNSTSRYRLDSINSRAYDIHTAWGKAAVKPTNNSKLELAYSFQDANHVLYPYLTMDAVNDTAHIMNLTYRIEKISPLVRELKFQAYWDMVDHLMDDSHRVGSLPFVTHGVFKDYSMSTDATSMTYGVKGKGDLAIGPGILRSGVDYYNRNWNMTTQMLMPNMAPLGYMIVPSIPDVTVDNVGVYSEYEIPLASRLKLKAAARADITWVDTGRLGEHIYKQLSSTGAIIDTGRTDMDTFRSIYGVYPPNSLDFAEVSGNLQLTWNPIEGLEVFTGLGRGVRTPDPQELYIARSVWIGNPWLKPTKNYETDLGFKYSTDRFYVKGTLFFSYLADYINIFSIRPAAGVKSYQNISATMWGAELGSQVSLPYNLFLKGSLSYTEGENQGGNRPLSEIPPLRGTIAVRYDNGAMFVELSENLAAKQSRVDQFLLEQPTGGWATTDLKVGVNYKNLTLYAGVYNLFDKFYYNYLSYQRDPFSSGVKVPENGRNFYVTLQYRL